MRFRDRRKTLIACLGMAVVVALPGVAQAGDDGEPTGEEPTVTESTAPEHRITEVLSTLPVLGSGLNVTITRDEEGAIASVGLDPDGATVVKEKDHKVVFLLSDGDTEVVVKARGGSVQTKVKADATADVTGPGSWSADVFGNGAVAIPYTVSFDGNTPTITIGDVVGPEGVTAEVGDPKIRTSDDGDKSSYKVKVRLTSGDDSAKVSFVAKTRVDDEGEVKVSLAVTVSSRDRDKGDDDDDQRRGDKRDRDDDDDDRRGDKRDRDGDGDGRRGDHKDDDNDGDDDDGGNGDGN